MAHNVKITGISDVTHDVKRITVEKPDGLNFEPGQATDVAIDKPEWRDEQRPFTFTSLNSWPELEFIIKIYPEHGGVTEQIGMLREGDRLLIEDPWGAIRYKGQGCFIAGGAGVTPFIAIIRDLQSKGELSGNSLVFSNRTESDIILRSEIEAAKGLDYLFTVTDQPESELARGMIDREFLEKHVSNFEQEFYVCGPPEMVESVSACLKELGAKPDSIVFEE
jgi:hypothetical protein